MTRDKPSAILKTFVYLSPLAILAGGFSSCVGFMAAFFSNQPGLGLLVIFPAFFGFLLFVWSISLWRIPKHEEMFWIIVLIYHLLLLPLPLLVFGEFDLKNYTDPAFWPILGLSAVGIILSLLYFANLSDVRKYRATEGSSVKLDGIKDTEIETVIRDGMPYNKAKQLLDQYYVNEGMRSYQHPDFGECVEYTLSKRVSSSSIVRLYVKDDVVRGFE